MLFRHLLNELARKGKTILYISHVLEVVEKVCAHVVIIYKGRIMAADSVERLRDLTNAPRSRKSSVSWWSSATSRPSPAKSSAPRAANVGRPILAAAAFQAALRWTNSALGDRHCNEPLGGGSWMGRGGGMSELAMSSITFHDPSGSFRYTVMYLPWSVTGSCVFRSVRVIR